jgi:hypothetical protein
MPSIKTVLDEMSKKDRLALAHLYETDGYNVLVRFMELCRINAGKSALLAQDFNEVKHLQGQAHGLKQLHLNIKENHKKMNKD